MRKCLEVSEIYRKFAPNFKTNHMRHEKNIEVLLFQRDGETATAVTDGTVTRTYTATACKAHSTLHRAIAHLACMGYQITI